MKTWKDGGKALTNGNKISTLSLLLKGTSKSVKVILKIDIVFKYFPSDDSSG